MKIDRTPRPVRESHAILAELALPSDANNWGFLLGGKLMHLVDVCGALAAMKHARCPVVTASADSINFMHPVYMNQLITLQSSVNRVFKTSMEVGVRVVVEDVMTGERRHTTSAYLTFVAIDENGKPVPVAPVLPETEEEKRRYEEAGVRREYRLARRSRLKRESSGSDQPPSSSSSL
ncbi:MAG: acyl-CoA thioesterase [Bryobacterales bacterium]|nr:acyl-CoA thioesterase [Bryobacterales bacterium]